MTKYEEFITVHSSFCTQEWQDVFKKQLDEVIEERLYKFRGWYNNQIDTYYIDETDIENFLQNKEE